MDELDRVKAATEPLDRVRLATEAIASLQDAVVELGKLRLDAVAYLRSQGMTLTEIAEGAGVSKARIAQLKTSRRAPERALFTDHGAITIAVDIKQEDATGRPVVHQEHTAAIDILSRSARSMGVDVNEIEYIVPPGTIDLNRDGLVVVCGPRRSSLIEQLLASDERYGFAKDAAGWYLVDKASGREYRSPEDAGQSGDVAYLGVIPRPDGRGNWLYMAGVHAPGGQGAAMYLTENLSDLYSQVKDSERWSCLVECSWDPQSRHFDQASLLAPIHKVGRSRARQRRK